ncbi:MAG TPA: hypothetical protein VIL68_01320 [Propionibacteriaceae bacterium]
MSEFIQQDLSGAPWDWEIQPSLDEVLAVRAERRALIHGVLDGLTQDELDLTAIEEEN